VDANAGAEAAQLETTTTREEGPFFLNHNQQTK
jgi:hypothetical protein